MNIGMKVWQTKSAQSLALVKLVYFSPTQQNSQKPSSLRNNIANGIALRFCLLIPQYLAVTSHRLDSAETGWAWVIQTVGAAASNKNSTGSHGNNSRIDSGYDPHLLCGGIVLH